jgi:hypothetical protein
VTGAEVYPHRPDLKRKWFYRCAPCRAWVGCHPNSKVPLGRLADAELRKAKEAAHAHFDPLWKAVARRDGISNNKARGRAYAWLADQMSLAPDDCHIGMFDVGQCNRVIRICNGVRRREIVG